MVNDKKEKGFDGFWGHIFISASGGIGAGLFMFLANILAGRFLGPIEYGKYALMLAYAPILLIPMIWGFDTATMHYLSKKSGQEEKICGTSLKGVTTNAILIFIILYLALDWSSNQFGISKEILSWALVYALVLGIRNLCDSILRGTAKFKMQSIAKISEAITVFVILGIFLAKNHYKFESYSIAMIIGTVFFVMIVMSRIKSWIGNFDWVMFKTLFYYGSSAIIGGIAGILLFSAGRILIERFLGEEELGIYMAYSVASFALSGQFFSFFNNVFFPKVSSMSNKAGIAKRLDRIQALTAIPLFLLVVLSTTIILYLFGEQYKKEWDMVFLFSVMAIFQLFYKVNSWLTAAEGIRGLRKSVSLTITGGILNVVLTIVGLQLYELKGVIIAGIITNAFLMIGFQRMNHRLFEE